MKIYSTVASLILLLPTLCFADNADQCYERLVTMPQLSPIANKMSFPDISKASFEQLANTDKATDQEKPLIAKYAEGSKICFELDMSLQPYNLHPRAKTTLNEYQSNKISNLIDLYNQKISYGEFIKQRQEASVKFNSEMEIVDKEVAAYNSKAEADQEAQTHKNWENTFQGLSNAFKRKPSVTCTPNGYGGMRCQ